ncbi:MAG: hypothetical protein RL748_3879 [Pseudomonadota bacterium]
MNAQINLLNPALRKKKQQFSARIMLLTLACLGFGMLCWTGYVLFATHNLELQALRAKTLLSQAKEDLAKVTAEKVPRAKNARLEAQVKDMESRVLGLLKVSSELKKGDFGNASGYSGYLRAFAQQRMDGIWLTSVSVSDSGNDIGLQGEALQAVLLPQYLQRLSKEEVLRGKAFESLEMQRKAAPQATAGAALPQTAAQQPQPVPGTSQAVGIDTVLANSREIANAINNPAALAGLITKLGSGANSTGNSATAPVLARANGATVTSAVPPPPAQAAQVDVSRLPLEFSLQARTAPLTADGKEAAK